jgi:hypothetical protein
MATMVEVGLCGIGPDDALPRMDAPDEFSADEIRGALAWTRSAASTQLSLAWDLIGRLSQVFAALDAGAIDVPKAKVFSEWTIGLADEQTHMICARLLPEAPSLTTGQLAERVKKLAIAIDPDWTRRRYEEAVRERKVVGYRNDDGTANVSGYQLPTDRAAAACAHIDALARKVKRAGDARPLDRIRADLFLGMLDGTYADRSETSIIAHMLATADEGNLANHTSADSETDRTADADVAAPRHRPPSHPQHGDQDESHQIDERGPGNAVTAGPRTHPSWLTLPPGRAGVEIRAKITTLLGLDQHPGEIPGWGPVHSDLTRRLVRDQTAAEWRYAITDEHGRLLYEDITRHRPDGHPARAASPCRGGIAELQITLPDLRKLSARPAQSGGWAEIIADLAGHLDRFECERDESGETDREDNGRGGRAPGRALRRRTEIRDRTCVHPRCRAPAHGTDGDHTQDWADGGPTRDGNIGSVCRHDHRLKHEGGWTVSQPRPGHFVWISRLGRIYHVHPPLIIEPLPDPIPRDPPPVHAPHDDNAEDGRPGMSPAVHSWGPCHRHPAHHKIHPSDAIRCSCAWCPVIRVDDAPLSPAVVGEPSPCRAVVALHRHHASERPCT